jgi:hypothetical protein
MAALAVRYGIPAALVLAGLVCLFVVPSGTRFEAWALFTGAGLSVLLLNLLFRIGVQGDLDRDREDAARAYFEEHGGGRTRRSGRRGGNGDYRRESRRRSPRAAEARARRPAESTSPDRHDPRPR